MRMQSPRRTTAWLGQPCRRNHLSKPTGAGRLHPFTVAPSGGRSRLSDVTFTELSMMHKPNQSLLIVNADDLGRVPGATDAIVACHRHGAISSATGMVWMQDSRRAADLAARWRIPVGLHLNFTEPYSDSGVPRAARDRHAQLIAHFKGRARWLYSPRLQAAVEEVIQEQLRVFESTYGQPPTHIDGHQHVQFTPNVLLAGTLPCEMKLRRTHTFARGEKWGANRLVRQALHLALARRHPTTRYMFPLPSIHPRLGGSKLEEKLALSFNNTVEIMCHPEIDGERAVLLDADWVRRLSALPVGSFESL
jgi:chitin disaccharide deacetylase